MEHDFSKMTWPSRPLAGCSPAERWKSLEAALASALFFLDDAKLIIEVTGTNRYVQLRALRGHGLVVEAVSNAFLDPGERLGDAEIDGLVALGWQPPVSEAPGSDRSELVPSSPNYSRVFGRPVSFPEVARLLVRTFVEVFRVQAPEQLEYKAFGDGYTLSLPTIGIRRRAEPA